MVDISCLYSFSIISSSFKIQRRFSGLISRRTPPIILVEIITRLPAVASIISITRSRTSSRRPGTGFQNQKIRVKAQPKHVGCVRCSSDQTRRKCCARGELKIHQLFYGVAIAHGVQAGTNSTNPLHHIDHLVKITNFSKLFQTTVNITQIGNHSSVTISSSTTSLRCKRLRQYRVLRAKWDNRSRHRILPYSLFF